MARGSETAILATRVAVCSEYLMRIEVFIVVWVEAGNEGFVPEPAKGENFFECFREEGEARRRKKQLEAEADRLQADLSSTTWESRDAGAKGNYEVRRAVLEVR